MTLCIAASCYGKHWPRIVVSSDWKAEVGDFAAAEIQNKLHWLFRETNSSARRQYHMLDQLVPHVRIRKEVHDGVQHSTRNDLSYKNQYSTTFRLLLGHDKR